jgi:hypothetical protein
MFFACSKIKLFCGYKNGRAKKFLPSPLLLLLLDPGWIKIRIRDKKSRIRNTGGVAPPLQTFAC